MGMGTAGMSLGIDGRAFAPERTDQLVRSGKVEEWSVVNTTPVAHPFHLHVWPFVVLATSDNASLSGTPQDVVLVPPQDWVRLRTPFTAHPGRSGFTATSSTTKTRQDGHSRARGTRPHSWSALASQLVTAEGARRWD
ncbi:multicopper oxidase domain-containing protein [Salinifilum ghardaiensis]